MNPRDPRMCRPNDRTVEREVAETMSRRYKMGFVLSSENSAHDFTLVQPGEPPAVRALVEVKRRRMWFGQYPTIHLGVQKIKSCLAMAENYGAKFVFAVKCDTGLYVTEITPQMLRDLPRKIGGRRDRFDLNISTDIEELLDIPIEEFEKIQ